MTSPTNLLERLHSALGHDKPRLGKIDRYMRGESDLPYAPKNASQEFQDIARRSLTPLCPLIVSTSAQMLFVDSYRTGDGATESPMMQFWRESRMPARQAAVYRGALGFGHAFVLVEKGRDGRPSIKGLSPMRTAALYVDAANDEDPYAVLTIDLPRQGELDGSGRLWTDEYVFPVVIDGQGIRLRAGKRHGFSKNPVTRLAASVDLEGRTMGVVEPMMGLQDRVNQAEFDLLITSTFGAFKVRWITGMAPPLEIDPLTGQPKVDASGRPIPKAINVNAQRLLIAKDSDTKFGTLDHTPLDGYIAAVQQAHSEFAALSQTPPHHLLGRIANLSAEALMAAETALSRRVEEFRSVFGAAWGRVFRLCAELMGDEEAASDYAGEVVWRDMERVNPVAVADGLGKMAEMLGIPPQGLWHRVPGTTQTEIDGWTRLLEQQNPVGTLTSSIVANRQRRTVASATAEAEASEAERTL